MRKLITISHVAKGAGVSDQAVYNYEKVGLLKPTKIIPVGGYSVRLYSPSVIDKVKAVRALSRQHKLVDIKKILKKGEGKNAINSQTSSGAD